MKIVDKLWEASLDIIWSEDQDICEVEGCTNIADYLRLSNIRSMRICKSCSEKNYNEHK
jgi:hypothetical protein